MNRIAITVLLAVSIPLSARADEASHRAKAQAMMNLLHTQQMVERNAEGLKTRFAAMANNAIGSNPTPAKKADAETFLKQAGQKIDAKLSWSSMQSGITDIYVKNFTEEQLDAIVAFYKTPAGSALLNNMNTVSTQVAAFGTQRLAVELQPEIMPLIKSFEAKEAPAASKPAPASTPSASPHTPARHSTPAAK